MCRSTTLLEEMMARQIMSMVMCIQNLVKFCPLIIKVLRKNQFLTSLKHVKGCYSITNLQNMMIYNTNLDLVNDNVYTKLG